VWPAARIFCAFWNPCMIVAHRWVRAVTSGGAAVALFPVAFVVGAGPIWLCRSGASWVSHGTSGRNGVFADDCFAGWEPRNVNGRRVRGCAAVAPGVPGAAGVRAARGGAGAWWGAGGRRPWPRPARAPGPGGGGRGGGGLLVADEKAPDPQAKEHSPEPACGV